MPARAGTAAPAGPACRLPEAGACRTLPKLPDLIDSRRIGPNRPNERQNGPVRAESYRIVRNRAEWCRILRGCFSLTLCRAGAWRFPVRKHARFSLRRRCLHPVRCHGCAVRSHAWTLPSVRLSNSLRATAAPLAAVLVRAEVDTAAQSAALAPWLRCLQPCLDLALYSVVKQLHVCARIARHPYLPATYLVFACKRHCWGRGPRGNPRPGRR